MMKHEKCLPDSTHRICLTGGTKGGLTFQEVELTGRYVEAHEVEAAGGPAASPLGYRLPGGQTLQNAALAGSIQTEDQDLTPLALLFFL